MRKSARSVKIDYRVLNSAGEKVKKYDQLIQWKVDHPSQKDQIY